MKVKEYIVGNCRESGKITHYHSVEEAEGNAMWYKIIEASSWPEAKMQYQEMMEESQELNN